MRLFLKTSMVFSLVYSIMAFAAKAPRDIVVKGMDNSDKTRKLVDKVAGELEANFPKGERIDKLVELVKGGNSTQLLAALIRGADPNHTDGDGVSLLEHARAVGNDKVADILIRYGAEGSVANSEEDNADENSCGLHQAVLSGQVDEVKAILAGSDIDINVTDSLGRTALHHAAITGNHDMLAELIGSGADTSIQDNLGRTAADYADFAMEDDIAAALQPATDTDTDEDYDAIINSVLEVREQNKTCNNFNNL